MRIINSRAGLLVSHCNFHTAVPGDLNGVDKTTTNEESQAAEKRFSLRRLGVKTPMFKLSFTEYTAEMLHVTHTDIYMQSQRAVVFASKWYS